MSRMNQTSKQTNKQTKKTGKHKTKSHDKTKQGTPLNIVPLYNFLFLQVFTNGKLPRLLNSMTTADISSNDTSFYSPLSLYTDILF